MMTIGKWLCIFITLGARVVLAESSEALLLEEYRGIYDETTAAYETEFHGASQAWPIAYIKALQALQTKLQASGNLDGWEAVDKELTRFRDTPTLEKTKSSSAEVRAIQERYRAQSWQLKTERDARIDDLRSKYVSRLVDLQREWTQQGKFDSAFAARNEITRVGGVPKAAPEEDAVAPSTATDRRPEMPRAKATSPTDVITHADGTEVGPPGTAAPNKAGMLFKNKRLSPTEHSPWSGSVSVKLLETSNKDSASFERDKLVGTIDGKTKSDERYARVILRMAKSDIQMRDLKLQVEYFAKPASGSGDPRLVTQKRIPIPFLDSRTVYVNVAPVSIESLSRSLSFGRFREHTQTIGDKFYGYIVTLVDANNTLLYQGASNNTLARMATVSAPDPPPMEQRPFGGEEGRQGGEKSIDALRAEVEDAQMALEELESGAQLNGRGPDRNRKMRLALMRLKEARDALRRAENDRR